MSVDLDIGFIGLTDAASLIVAHELGMFEAEGLRATLRREYSWATIRDKLAAGLYQGAHMLAPLALAAKLGAGSEPADMIAPLSLNAHGAAIGVSRALAGEMAGADGATSLDASALAMAAARRRARGAPAISFAVVFPFSMHNYMLRHWAAAAGIDPDRDLRIVTAPPTAVAARLRSGEIDGFCVGAPWGALCESESGARIVLEAGDFWEGGPDKVLALSRDWATRAPDHALGITRAILRAAAWADAPENVPALAALLARPDYVGAPAALIAAKLGAGDKRNIRFARRGAAAPRPTHAYWILSQMLRWGQIDRRADLDRARSVYREDIYHAAAAAIGSDDPYTDAPPPPDGEAHAPVTDAPSASRAAAAQAITRHQA